VREKYLESVEKELWINMDIKDKMPKSVAGVDGSNVRVDFQGFTLYGVDAVATFYDDVKDLKYSNSKVYALADLDVLIPPRARERIDLYREILEAKTALLTVLENDVELLLMDGSLKSVLITPSIEPIVVAMDKVSKIFGDHVYLELYNLLSKSLRSYDKLRDQPIITKLLITDESKVLTEDDYLAVVLLEYIEKLESYRRLLLKCFEKDTLLAFISKTGRSQAYFADLGKKLRKYIPADITVFQNLTSSPGYSKPRMEDRPIKGMPNILSLREFYDKLRIAVTYIRLEEGGPVLKLEIPYIINVDASTIEGDTIRLLSYLKGISPQGYPYVLMEAHELSRISKDTINRIIYSLDLIPQRTGREVLEGWLM